MAFIASSLLRVDTSTGRRGWTVKQAAVVRVSGPMMKSASPERKVVAKAVSVVGQRSVYNGGIPDDEAGDPSRSRFGL